MSNKHKIETMTQKRQKIFTIGPNIFSYTISERLSNKEFTEHILSIYQSLHWEGGVRSFCFLEERAEDWGAWGVHLERRLHPLCLPGVSFILRVNTEILKLLVWITTWSCGLIEYSLYNEGLRSKSSE